MYNFLPVKKEKWSVFLWVLLTCVFFLVSCNYFLKKNTSALKMLVCWSFFRFLFFLLKIAQKICMYAYMSTACNNKKPYLSNDYHYHFHWQPCCLPFFKRVFLFQFSFHESSEWRKSQIKPGTTKKSAHFFSLKMYYMRTPKCMLSAYHRIYTTHISRIHLYIKINTSAPVKKSKDKWN